MYVIRGCYHRRRNYDEYVATDPKMKNKSDQSYIVHSLDKADKFNTREEAEKYLDHYDLRGRYWEVIEI